jgi:CHAT domain-containing protein
VTEIAEQRYERVPLIVMSACQWVWETIEGGRFSLAQGWLAAGGSQVDTALCEFEDETTKDLMADFVARMVVENVRPEVALRSAMLAARDQRKVPTCGWVGAAGTPQAGARAMHAWNGKT